MPKNFEKFLFLGAVVAFALLSRAFYPGLYRFADGATGNLRSNQSLTAAVPLLILPSPSDSTATPQISVANEPTTMLGNGTVPVSNTPISAPKTPAITGSSTAAANSSFTKIGNAPVPTIADEATMVADLDAGTVYVGTNADMRWPLASVTKLMTASLVVDDLNLAQKVTIPSDAIAADPSQQFLSAGETFTVSDLLHILLLPSSNVAAESLADYYGRTRFIAQMNARAASWGMTNTHYDDPSGLSASNQSTPNDLLKLAQKISADYPQILAITRTPQITVTDLSSGKAISVRSINDFAGRADFIGGKTGYTDEANGNLLSIFKYKNHPVLVLVMGTSDDQRFDNTLMVYNWFVQNYK